MTDKDEDAANMTVALAAYALVALICIACARLCRAFSGDGMDCPTGKQQHDYERATRLAKRASRSYDKPMGVYRCTECGAWHVGTAIPRPQPMRWVSSNHESRFI